MSHLFFMRTRRGVPEVIHCLHFKNSDAQAALALARNLVGTRFWPTAATVLRITDESGQTHIDWMVPLEHTQLPQIAAVSLPLRDDLGAAPRSSGPDTSGAQVGNRPYAGHRDHSATGTPHPPHNHRFAAGQPISYAPGGTAAVWHGGYEITELLASPGQESRYLIRSADESYSRVADEHELQEDLGSRFRGQ